MFTRFNAGFNSRPARRDRNAMGLIAPAERDALGGASEIKSTNRSSASEMPSAVIAEQPATARYPTSGLFF